MIALARSSWSRATANSPRVASSDCSSERSSPTIAGAVNGVGWSSAVARRAHPPTLLSTSAPSRMKLMLQGGFILLGALVVSSVGGWARRATADDQPTPLTAPAIVGELRSLEQSLEATRGELAVARLQLERANAIIDYSTHDNIAADLAAAIYDVALAEGVDPALAFRLVKVESGFNSKAKSKVGAIGYTQVLPSTARLYEPWLTTAQLYDRGTNLRLGFRYLRDLLERYEGNADAKLRLALLAYNRGPGRVQELLDAGKDPQNGYAAALMKGYRRKS